MTNEIKKNIDKYFLAKKMWNVSSDINTILKMEKQMRHYYTAADAGLMKLGFSSLQRDKIFENWTRQYAGRSETSEKNGKRA